MKKDKTEISNKGKNIKADLYSRPNAMNGKYKVGQLGLDNFATIRNDDLFFLETLEMKANLADKMIVEADLEGKNTNDLNIMKDLGIEINSLATPLHRYEVITATIYAALQLVLFYGIIVGIWGLFFKKSFLEFCFYGAILGLLIFLLFASPSSFQRTKENFRDQLFVVISFWKPLGIVVGIVGVVALTVRRIFF